MGPVAAVIGAVVGAVGTVMQVSAARKAAKAQQRMADLQERQQQIATRRSRRQAIRQAQIVRAQAISAGANYGGLQGSGLAGGLSSLGSQVGAELGFSTQMSGISSDINAAQKDFLKAQQQGSMWGAIGGLGFSVFRQAGGFGAFSGGRSPTPTSPAAATGGGGYVSYPFRAGGTFSNMRRPQALPIAAGSAGGGPF